MVWQKFTEPEIDKRKLPKIERIKDGILNPVRIITPNGFKAGDIVRYKPKPKYESLSSFLTNHWRRRIYNKIGKIVSIKKSYTDVNLNGKSVFRVCIDFFEDIGKGSCWKHGSYRHGRWAWEDSVIKIGTSLQKQSETLNGGG